MEIKKNYNIISVIIIWKMAVSLYIYIYIYIYDKYKEKHPKITLV